MRNVRLKRNVISTEEGLQIYDSLIHQLADDYISTLDNPDLMYGANKGVFNGMIKYIYLNYFKNNRPDYNDIRGLDFIWNIYTELCYKYNKRPTILNFCVMLGIGKDTINTWLNGEYRAVAYFDSDGNEITNLCMWKSTHKGEKYVEKPSKKHSETAKRWIAECEAALLDGATDQNSIGCIFALKACHGYRDQSPVPVIVQRQNSVAIEDMEQDSASFLSQIADKN